MKNTDPAVPPIHEAAERRDWPAYFDRIEGKPPRDTLTTAIARFAEADRAPEGTTPIVPVAHERTAIDLGCGSGRDTAELLVHGWRVLAIDGHPEGIDRLRARPACIEHRNRLTTRVCDFGDIELPECDLINASFALPFCAPAVFPGLWSRIVHAIVPGGRFAGQLFGERDSWAVLEDRTHLVRGDAIELFDGFVLESFREEDRPGTSTTSAHKHWHVYHIVARKR